MYQVCLLGTNRYSLFRPLTLEVMVGTKYVATEGVFGFLFERVA